MVYNAGMAQLAGAAEVGPDGTIVTVFSRLTDAIVGNTGLIFRSSDAGRTWQDSGFRLQNDHFDEGAIHVALGMTVLPDGRILLPYSDFESGRESPHDHPRHMKLRPRRCVPRMIDSMDSGQTWSLPRDLELGGDFNRWHLYGKIRVVEDRLLMPAYTARIDAGRQIVDQCVSFAVSCDSGLTWPDHIEIRVEGGEFLDESDMIALASGDWLVVSRNNHPDCQLRMTRSADGGRSWSPIEVTGIRGHSPSLLLTSSGRIVVAYRCVSTNSGIQSVGEGGRAGLGISWSDDDGRSWQGEMVLRDPGHYAYQHGHETGMPSMLMLPDGRVAVVFYSYDPHLPFEPEDEIWAEVSHFYKRYIAVNILEEAE